MIIYRATNLSNGMSYIGQTIKSLRKRRLQHFCENKNTRFKNALDYYGDDNFYWEILECCDTKEELDEMEFHYIKRYNTKSPNGYNLTDGGDYGTFGWEPTEETKNSISNSLKDKWENDLEFRDRMTDKLKEIDNSGENNPRYGDHRTWEEKVGKEKADQIKEKISKSSTGRKMKEKDREKLLGENNPAKRPEARKKISDAQIGRKRPKEVGEKVSQAKKGVTWEDLYGKEEAERKKERRRNSDWQDNLRKSKSKYLYKAISPEGEEYEFTSLNKFSDDMGFCRAGPKYHLRNNTDNYKGWKIYIIDTLN